MDETVLLADLVESLKRNVGKPTVKRPSTTLKADIESEGIGPKEFLEFLQAVTSSRHSLLAARCVPLLIPRYKIEPIEIATILEGFSRTDSNALRSNLAKYLYSMWDAGFLSPAAKDSLRAGYGVIFHFIYHEKIQEEVSRLLYRLTRKVDVTKFRCRELSRLLAKLSTTSRLIALAELYDSFLPDTVVFPPREHGVAGASGLTEISRIKLHEKVSRKPEFAKRMAKRKKLFNRLDGALEMSLANERRYSTKRPRMLGNMESDPGVVFLADQFSFLRPLEADPNKKLEREIENSLFAQLETWDGFSSKEEILEAISQLSYPQNRLAQDTLNRKIIRPLMNLVHSADPSLSFFITRSLARMLGVWLKQHPEDSLPLVLKIVEMLEDNLSSSLALTADDPLITIALAEIYCGFAHGMVNRRKAKINNSLLKMPNENVCFRLMLSPSVLGTEILSLALDSLVPAYLILKAVSGKGSRASKSLESVRYIATVISDLKGMLYSKDSLEPFYKDATVVDEVQLAEAAQHLENNELDIVHSIAFSNTWREWVEERELLDNPGDNLEVLRSFIVHLRKTCPSLSKVLLENENAVQKLLQ